MSAAEVEVEYGPDFPHPRMPLLVFTGIQEKNEVPSNEPNLLADWRLKGRGGVLMPMGGGGALCLVRYSWCSLSIPHRKDPKVLAAGL
jgi:hypothetical protein